MEKALELQKLKEALVKFEMELSSSGAKDGDYCVLVYSRSLMSGCKSVKFVYRNTAIFEEKVLSDVKVIDEMYAIDFQIWFFD